MEAELAQHMAENEVVMDKTRRTITNLGHRHAKMLMALASQLEQAEDFAGAVQIYEELEMYDEAKRVRLFMDI